MRRKAERFAPYAAVLGSSLLAEASEEAAEEAGVTSFSEDEALSALDSAFDSLLDSPEDSLCEEEAAVDPPADVLWLSPDAPDEEELLPSDVLPEEAAGFDSGAETLLTEMVSVLLLTVVPL